MKAACHIKQKDLDSVKRNYELLPAFLKAGVYYQDKLLITRKQPYHLRKFAYDLLVNEAKSEYYKGNFDRSARRYEEAFSLFKYFENSNPKWSTEGIADKYLSLVDVIGEND